LRFDLAVLSAWEADFSTWDAVPETSEPYRSTLDAPWLLLGADDPMLEPVVPDDGLGRVIPVAPPGEAPPLGPPVASPGWATAAPLNSRAPITPAIAIVFIRLSREAIPFGNRAHLFPGCGDFAASRRPGRGAAR
jgi:hypothetical protein